jgi:flagellar assembly factor FliW
MEMKVQTSSFGELEVQEESVYFFSKGIPGFEHARYYVSLEVNGHEPFTYLQSTEKPDLVFIMIDPFEFFPHYEFNLTNTIMNDLKVEQEKEIIVRAIVNTRNGISEATANLIGPIILNSERRVGMQVILALGDYTTKHRLFTPDVKG